MEGDSGSMRTFEEIEALRARHGLTRTLVCRQAGVNRETWRRTARRITRPNTATLARLSAALEALIAGREAAE